MKDSAIWRRLIWYWTDLDITTGRLDELRLIFGTVYQIWLLEPIQLSTN